MAGKTLYDKLGAAHVVRQHEDGTCLLYIDRHLVHEVTSPQAFEALRLAGRRPWRVAANLATADHNVPTTDRGRGIAAHGAFGALAFGIGTSEVEHALATQCLIQKKSKNMRVRVDGAIPPGVTAKDIVLAIIGRIGTAGGTGHAIEFAGTAIEQLSVEGRMTVCNMAIEAGARAGMIAVGAKTIEYFRGRPYAPQGAMWERAVKSWRGFKSDVDAKFDKENE